MEEPPTAWMAVMSLVSAPALHKEYTMKKKLFPDEFMRGLKLSLKSSPSTVEKAIFTCSYFSYPPRHAVKHRAGVGRGGKYEPMCRGGGGSWGVHGAAWCDWTTPVSATCSQFDPHELFTISPPLGVRNTSLMWTCVNSTCIKFELQYDQK